MSKPFKRHNHGFDLEVGFHNWRRVMIGGRAIWDCLFTAPAGEEEGGPLVQVENRSDNHGRFHLDVEGREVVHRSRQVSARLSRRVQDREIARLRDQIARLTTGNWDQRNAVAALRLPNFHCPEMRSFYRFHGRLWKRRLLILWGAEPPEDMQLGGVPALVSVEEAMASLPRTSNSSWVYCAGMNLLFILAGLLGILWGTARLWLGSPYAVHEQPGDMHGGKPPIEFVAQQGLGGHVKSPAMFSIGGKNGTVEIRSGPYVMQRLTLQGDKWWIGNRGGNSRIVVDLIGGTETSAPMSVGVSSTGCDEDLPLAFMQRQHAAPREPIEVSVPVATTETLGIPAIHWGEPSPDFEAMTQTGGSWLGRHAYEKSGLYRVSVRFPGQTNGNARRETLYAHVLAEGELPSFALPSLAITKWNAAAHQATIIPFVPGAPPETKLRVSVDGEDSTLYAVSGEGAITVPVTQSSARVLVRMPPNGATPGVSSIFHLDDASFAATSNQAPGNCFYRGLPSASNRLQIWEVAQMAKAAGIEEGRFRLVGADEWWALRDPTVEVRKAGSAKIVARCQLPEFTLRLAPGDYEFTASATMADGPASGVSKLHVPPAGAWWERLLRFAGGW